MNIIEDLKLEKEKGMSIDDAIQWLHDSGESKVASIATIAKVYTVPLARAKTMVHENKAWTEVKGRDEEFHKNLTDNLE